MVDISQHRFTPAKGTQHARDNLTFGFDAPVCDPR